MQDPALAAARALVDRIRRRDLYKMVDEVIIPLDIGPQLPFVTEQVTLYAYRALTCTTHITKAHTDLSSIMAVTVLSN